MYCWCHTCLSGRWSFHGLGSETKWYSTHDSKPQGERDESRWIDDDRVRKKRTASCPIHESVVSERVKCKEGGNLSFQFCADGRTIEAVFRTITLLISSVSTEQSQNCVNSITWLLVCANKFVDDNTFDRWSCARRSIAKAPRTSGKAITTRSCD